MMTNSQRQKWIDYDGFVEKFKPKKTTDDCYTPEPVYNAVRDWVVEEYGLDASKFVRPFYPNGDYENYDYPDDCVVVDNPPFSILAIPDCFIPNLFAISCCVFFAFNLSFLNCSIKLTTGISFIGGFFHFLPFL